MSQSVSLRLITFEPPRAPHPIPIVCVPGLVTHISCWGEMLRDLTKDFKVYYLETREKESSIVMRGEDFGLDSLTRDLVEVLSRLHLNHRGYVLFGSSLGANVILEGCRHPAVRPLALVLIGPNAKFHVPTFWKSVISVYPTKLYPLFKPVIRWYYRTFRVDAESDPVQYQKYCMELETSDPLKMKKVVTSFGRYDIWPVLKAIPCPTLVIGASKDKMHEASVAQNIAAGLPRGSYVEMETNTLAHSRLAATELRKFLGRLTNRPQGD